MNITLPQHSSQRSVKGGWSLSDKYLGAGSLRNAVRKREFEVLGKELLDVWTLDIIALLELDDLEDLIQHLSVTNQA
jgi:hypothetical protein